MIRIIVDSQSNRLFRGVPLEQNYDQRGGLCQVGEGHIVITTNPIDSDYLRYWSQLGFTLPWLLVAGPFNPQHTLSELIVRNESIQKELRDIIRSDEARLEFFCIEETERKLSEVLGIPPYCNFDVSIPLSRKHAFKKVCEDIGLPTASWVFCEGGSDFVKKGKAFLMDKGEFLAKADDGTGGISCGGMFKVENKETLTEAIQAESSSGSFVLEEIIDPKAGDISLHWEIDNEGKLRNINFFNQLSENFGYSGSSYPVKDSGVILDTIETQLRERMHPFLRQCKAIGYFCCDIIVDIAGGVYWTDLNPRKGAIIYVFDMVRRIADVVFGNSQVYFWHQHLRYNSSFSPREVLQKLGSVLFPSKNGFVVITNPGVISFGYIDVTGISPSSTEEARALFQNAVTCLNSGK